jgi:hypothetical protein
MAMDENGDGMVTLSASWPLPASVLVTNVCASVAVFSWGRYPDSPGGRVCSWSP